MVVREPRNSGYDADCQSHYGRPTERARCGDVGVVEGAPSHASSDVDLPPLGENSSDDDSDWSVVYVLVCSITSIERLAGFREFWFCRCPRRVLHHE